MQVYNNFISFTMDPLFYVQKSLIKNKDQNNKSDKELKEEEEEKNRIKKLLESDDNDISTMN